MNSRAPKSVIVPIVGGLGNQMFLIATGVATALRNRADLCVPPLEKSDSCGPPRPVYWKTMFKNIRPYMKFVNGDTPMLTPDATSSSMPENSTVIVETDPAEKIFLPNDSSSCILRGFFQSPIYFDDYKQHVRHLLVPPEYLNQASSEMERLILQLEKKSTQCSTKTLGVHIRRSDYLTNRDVFHISSLQEYYLPAIERLYGPLLLCSDEVELPLRVVVFSEDKVYAELFRNMLGCKYPSLAGRVVVSTIREDHIELLAMSLCDDLIIANSSFSWFSAYLNMRPLHRIIAPKKWFVGRSPAIYCDSWQVI